MDQLQQLRYRLHHQQQTIQRQQQQIIQQQQLINHYQQQHQQHVNLQDDHRNLQAVNTRQQVQIAELKGEVKSRTIGKQTTAFKDLSRPGRSKRIRDMTEVLSKVLNGVSQDASSIRVVFSFEEEEDREIIVRGTGLARTRAEQDAAEALQNTQRILNVKDRFRISYRALQALRIEAKISCIPTCKKLLDEAKRLSTALDIIPLSSRTVSQILGLIN